MVISKKKFLLSILKDVITPAYGCTEIGCVALCASIVAEHLKSKITKAEIYISPFIYRNDVNVGVPNLGQCGIVTIAAAGFVVKQSKKGLAVLSNISKSQIADARKLANAKVIKVMIQKHGDPVYCRVIAHDKFNNVCEVLIEHKHDLIKYIKLNNKTIFSKCVSKTKTNKSRYDVNEISLIDLFKVVNSFTLKEISFLKTGLIMNEKIMKKGFAQSDSLIKIATIVSNNIDSVKWRDHLVSAVVSAVDARMSGCPLPVMASNDSGDHGLTVILPQLLYSQEKNTSNLTMLRAIAFANLITWKIKQNIGSLSAYCGSVIAATTATLCGIGYQRKYSVKQVNDLINLCLCSYAGAICDGAKISCAWKIEAALISGFAAMEIVEHNASIPNGGMINKDAFETIRDLGKLSHKIMDETNSAVIDIVNKNDNK